MKIEGYWNEDIIFKLESKVKPGVFLERTIKDKNNYPTPIPNVLSEEEANKIYLLIKEKELTARITRYKGLSRSRITGERLGCIEYQTDEWQWPGDFNEHYVLKHKVKPSIEFLKYINYHE